MHELVKEIIAKDLHPIMNEIIKKKYLPIIEIDLQKKRKKPGELIGEDILESLVEISIGEITPLCFSFGSTLTARIASILNVPPEIIASIATEITKRNFIRYADNIKSSSIAVVTFGIDNEIRNKYVEFLTRWEKLFDEFESNDDAIYDDRYTRITAECREFGSKFFEIGGQETMLAMHDVAPKKLKRLIESQWSGIGEWRG